MGLYCSKPVERERETETKKWMEGGNDRDRQTQRHREDYICSEWLLQKVK